MGPGWPNLSLRWTHTGRVTGSNPFWSVSLTSLLPPQRLCFASLASSELEDQWIDEYVNADPDNADEDCKYFDILHQKHSLARSEVPPQSAQEVARMTLSRAAATCQGRGVMRFLRTRGWLGASGFSWRGATWSVALAAVVYGIHWLDRSRVVSDTALTVAVTISMLFAICLITLPNRNR